MNNKRGVELSLNTVIIAILLLVVLAIMIIAFQNLFGKNVSIFDDKVDCTKEDTDGDGVNDILDKCCNTPKSDIGDVGFNGCVSGRDPDPCKC